MLLLFSAEILKIVVNKIKVQGSNFMHSCMHACSSLRNHELKYKNFGYLTVLRKQLVVIIMLGFALEK